MLLPRRQEARIISETDTGPWSGRGAERPSSDRPSGRAAERAVGCARVRHRCSDATLDRMPSPRATSLAFLARATLYLASAVLAALLLAACGDATKPPPPTPADFVGITQKLAPRGIAATDIVSGDPGCTDPHLAPTAISFSASGLDQAQPTRVYLYIFKDRPAFDRNLGNVDACARSYVTNPAAYENVQVSPYIVAGAGPWAAGFRAALVEGLTQAAGGGG